MSPQVAKGRAGTFPPPSCDIAIASQCSFHLSRRDIAGIAYPARHSQPDMFSMLSWVGATRSLPDAAMPKSEQRTIKIKIDNRWVRIAYIDLLARHSPYPVPSPRLHSAVHPSISMPLPHSRLVALFPSITFPVFAIGLVYSTGNLVINVFLLNVFVRKLKLASSMVA